MATKTRKLEEFISLSADAPRVVSYVDYFARKPLFHSLKVKNEAETAAEGLTLTVTNENGLLAACVKEIAELPFESTVEIEPLYALSPAYFTSLEGSREEIIKIELKKDKKTVAMQEISVLALPFDFWEGLYGNAELIASFVRPKLADPARLVNDTAAQLKKWEVSGEIGYEGNDKNTVRRTIAAVFASLRRYAFTKVDADWTAPVSAGEGTRLIAEKKATGLELALLAAATLERMGLHPVLAIGERQVACGVWLYDSCFLDTVSDDTARIGEYISEGINNLSFFDVDDLFIGKNAAYSTSEVHFAQKLKAGEYERYVDVRRCRIARILPLPLKERGAKGYEILKEEEFSFDAAPSDLTVRKKLSLDAKQTKNKQWERRLLDLSLKNTLLNFRPEKGGVPLVSVSADETFSTLNEKGELTLLPATDELLKIAEKRLGFGLSGEIRALKELILLENSGGNIRSYLSASALSEAAAKLIRKGKEADEESGTKILYLAFGYLKWISKDGGEENFAPLILQPVALKKARYASEFTVQLLDDELSVNSTLLEFLKQEFDVDVRGLDGALQGLKLSEILAMVRMEVAGMKGWKVFDDVYLATFSFARYQMWQDVRKNIDEFSKNKLVSSLLNNRSELEPLTEEGVGEDGARPTATLLPLTADASQFEAIALSQTGKTFVLHGPPGTGKSQTITNMIANALNDGKRVLFVAEKQAALAVVKKRLDLLGLGEFCLELHSGKTAKAEVLQKLTSTLALAGSGEKVYLGDHSEKIERLRGELSAPTLALHKKRRLGVSVYEALLICLKHKNAPEIMNIESTFYDGLTKEKIARYEELMIQAAAAAKECGGVHNSPFANVNLTEYSPELRDAVYCAAEVVVAEIKHLKNYIALFLELYRQRMSTLTRKKLNGLFEVAKLLDGGSLGKYFFEKEEEFIAFYNANRRLDSALEGYFANFRELIKAEKEYEELSAWLEQGNADYSSDKTAKAVAKRLQRAAKAPLDDGQILKALESVCEIYGAMEIIAKNTTLAKNFTGAFGKVDYFKGRKAFLADLYALHDACALLFMDYNADSFNSMCIRAANGYTSPVLKGLVSSVESFRTAENGFLQITLAERSLVPEEDILEYYTLKAGALIDNIDMLANWCMYKQTAETLDKEGLKFITDALENGAVTGENIVGSFEKNIYKNFLQTNLPLDPVLSRFSAAVMEEETEALRLTIDEFARLTRNNIRYNLISRLPTTSTEGVLSIELVNFQRLAKNNLRGMGLRKLFEEIPELIKTLAPCMLMSPMTVSQYLAPENGMFDLVIFDEASQMPTAEAVASLARAKAAVIVGDPKQLPPTGFFTANYVDEENLENEDMESVLDDCLALGLPEKRLNWHYRSKHESLIAFSNLMYYGNKLCTFPSPDSLCSKVRFEYVESGVYDRGFTKRNKAEADALIAEVINRLSDPKKNKSSIGIVTFSSVQKEYIERRLSQTIVEKRLEEAAYEREEPLFVKNLENVQGDERDVILFSVCYGPDKNGRISLNFGPLNQAGGWRRLNVAVSRAREEMVVFSSMTGAMIDLAKTSSKGVFGLKAFLEFAEKGRTTLAIPSESLNLKKAGLGKYIASELSAYGYDCRADVGVSDFKIDVAVVDPKNKQRFILAVLCDTNPLSSVKDRNVLQIQTLKRNNWNVLRVFAVNYYNNPKREIKKIKDLLDKLTGADKKGGSGLTRAKKPYKYAALAPRIELSQYVTSGENDGEICARLKAIVGTEEPISYEFLIKRLLGSLGIHKYGGKVASRMQALVGLCGFKSERIFGEDYYRKTDKAATFDKYRVEQSEAIRKAETDFTPYEVVAIIRAALEDKVALYVEELVALTASVLKVPRPSERFALYINDCVSLGEERGYFVRSVSDRISLA